MTVSLSQLQKMERRIRRSIFSTFGRGVIHAYDSRKKFAQASFLAGEAQDRVEVFQSYGFDSSPPPGTECLAVGNGNRGSLVVIATKSRMKRTSIGKGDVLLWNLTGNELLLSQNSAMLKGKQNISIQAPTTISFKSAAYNFGNIELVNKVTELISLLETISVDGSGNLNGALKIQLANWKREWGRASVKSPQ